MESLKTLACNFYSDTRLDMYQVHGLTPELLKQREVVAIDIAADKCEPKDYKAEYDPLIFKSEKTGRGPLVPGEWQVGGTCFISTKISNLSSERRAYHDRLQAGYLRVQVVGSSGTRREVHPRGLKF